MQYIKTEKFTDTAISIKTMLPLKRETITALNTLLLMRRSRTEKYHTKQKFATALNLAYGLKVMFGLTGYGEQVCLDIKFQYIRDDFVEEEGYEAQILDIMDQVLNHPLITEKNFEEAKYLLKERLERALDDPESLALQKALAIVQPGHSIEIPIQGNLQDLDSLQLEDVIRINEIWMQAEKWVCVSGTASEAILDFCRKHHACHPEVQNHQLIHPDHAAECSLEKNIAQSALVQVYATGIDIQDALYYPLLVLNSILGQSPMSLLFEEIREKHSYCYGISSMLLRFDGAMLIFCQTKRKNLKHVQTLIEAQIQKLRQGEFEQERVEAAKMDLIDMLTSQADRPFGTMEQNFFDELLGRDVLQTAERIAQVETVTAEQIMQAAGRLKLAAQAAVLEGIHSEV